MDRENVMTDSKRSPGGRPGKGTARDRLRLERERERQSGKRLRTLKMAGVVTLVLGVTALISVAVAVTGKDGSESAEARPISTGAADAPVTMTVYEDFRCPACRQFEAQFRETIHELRDAGKLRVEYHLVTLIDGNLGGHGSQYAAGAAMCASDAGKFVEYHDVLYRNQPPEQQDAYGDKKKLLQLARQVDGLSTAKFETCVQEGRQADRVEGTQRAFLEGGYGQTPTVIVDGDRAFDNPADPLTPAKLRDLVEKKS